LEPQRQINDRGLELSAGEDRVCGDPTARIDLYARAAKIHGGANGTLRDLIAFAI
jgi:hypothetical protein